MLLSILVPAVYERGFTPLSATLAEQASSEHVEVLTLYDNRRRSTGNKRQKLLDAANGDFIVCLDDDDMVAADFVKTVLAAIAEAPTSDVIVYNSQSVLNCENPFIVRTGIEYENEQCRKENDRWVDIFRKPWHWCAWSSRLAKAAKFPDGYIDDDWFWLRQMIPGVQKQHRIDRVLHYYNYRTDTSLSQQGKPTT